MNRPLTLLGLLLVAFWLWTLFARNPQVIATARDFRDLYARLAAWPATFRRGLAYHSSGARHDSGDVRWLPRWPTGTTTIPALTAAEAAT